MKTSHLIYTAVAATVLGACSSDLELGTQGNNNQSGEELTLVGLVKMEPNSLEPVFSRALFGQLDDGLTASAIENYFAPTTDTCVVTRQNNTTTDPVPNFLIYDQRPTLISAGENVLVSSSAGTYVTLNRETTPTGPYYLADVQLNGPAPSGLTLDIPGDQFPAFSSIPFSDVPALQMTSPTQGQGVTPTTEFTWIANNVQRSVIEINAGATDTTNNDSIVVSCTVVDDGAFSFPESTRAEMGNSFDDDWSGYLRIIYNVAQSDNAILFIANSVAN